MMNVEETAQGNMITQTLDTTTGKEVSSMIKHFAFMNEAKMEQIEDRLAATYNECLDTKKLYEEQLKTSYVQKQRIEELEGKIQSLEEEVASLKDQIKTAIEVEYAQGNVEEVRHIAKVEFQIEDMPIGVTILVPVVNVEGEVSQSDCAPKRGVMMNMLNHMIGILKRISQDAYNAFTTLQAAEKM